MKTFAQRLRETISKLKADDLWSEPDLSYPFLVRWREPLHVALGRMCKAGTEYTPLGRDVLALLRDLKVVGLRSRSKGWFERDF